MAECIKWRRIVRRYLACPADQVGVGVVLPAEPCGPGGRGSSGRAVLWGRGLVCGSGVGGQGKLCGRGRGAYGMEGTVGVVERAVVRQLTIPTVRQDTASKHRHPLPIAYHSLPPNSFPFPC